MALKDLIEARTREEIMVRMLIALGQERYAGFPVNDWYSGGVARTLSEISAEAIADTERLLERIGYGGYLQTAEGEWLDEIVASQYGLVRGDSSFATGKITLSTSVGITLTINAGFIVQTASGLQYETQEQAIVPMNGSVDVAIRAVSPGSASNVSPGMINQALNPISGLSVNNGANWLTNAGSDVESDDALRQRASLRWSTLGSGMTRDAYVYWAKTTRPSIDQVTVMDENPRGPGTVDVMLWSTGGVGEDDVNAVNDVIQAKRPLTANVQVYSAAPKNVVIPLELYCPLVSEDRKKEIVGEIQSYFNTLSKTTPVGGKLYNSQIIEYAMTPSGVMDAVRTDANVDIQLGRYEGLVLYADVTFRSRQ